MQSRKRNYSLGNRDHLAAACFTTNPTTNKSGASALGLLPFYFYLFAFPRVSIVSSDLFASEEGNLTDAPARDRIIGLLQNLVDSALRIGPR